jgi:ribose transport system substrate-binding protein
LSATRMAEQLGSGQVVVLHSVPMVDDAESWLESVRGTLDQYAALEPVEASCPWTVAGTREVVDGILQQGVSPQGYLVSDGVLARGAVEAHLERGLGTPTVTGADDWNGWLRVAHLHGIPFHGLSGGADLGLRCVDLATQVLSGQPIPDIVEQPAVELCQDDLPKYFRPDLSDHYWAVHRLPDTWIERMFRM